MSAGRDPALRLADEVGKAARRARSSRTLILDLDGTLAPIAPRPEQARVPAETLDAVARLVRKGWRVAVVSGRPLRQLRRLVRLPGVRLFGSHGLEGLGTDEPDAGTRRRLAALERAARELPRGFPGARIESKPAGIAFHDRNVSAERLRAWRRRLRDWLDAQDLAGLETLRGRRVLELRPRGVHKGRVVEAIDGAKRARRDMSLVAIGDDLTDEDLFVAVHGRGLSVRVGRPKARTNAERRLPSPTAVRRFLERLGEST